MNTIAIDVSTGKGEGKEALEAAGIASLELNEQLLLLGDERVIARQLEGIAHDAEKIQVLHAPDTIDLGLGARDAMDLAVRSPIATGLEWVGKHANASFISAGHPGVIVLQAMKHLERFDTVRRAALATVYPTLRHRGRAKDPFALLLDVGATVECSQDDLVVFAAMGAAYSSKISIHDRPTVALLSNGTNPEAANHAVKRAHARLSELEADFEYLGCVRADLITLGEADVVITDGFTGDIVVRTLEGIMTTAEELLERAVARFHWRLGMSMLGDGIRKLRELTDWENYGGAPLLGFKKTVIVTQANSGRRAFINAIRLASKIDRTGALNAVEKAITDLRTYEM